MLRAIMDISARAISLADRPRTGHRGHQCSHAPRRPIRHRRLILSQITAGKGVGYVIDSLLASRLSAQARGFRQDLSIAAMAAQWIDGLGVTPNPTPNAAVCTGRTAPVGPIDRAPGRRSMRLTGAGLFTLLFTLCRGGARSAGGNDRAAHNAGAASPCHSRCRSGCGRPCVYDRAWVRRSHRRCLADGRIR
jgi:hypothetical protein